MCRSSIENGISVRRTTGCGPTAVPHQVVAVERDVERAGRHLVAGDLAERSRRAAGRAARRACGCRRARARSTPRLRSTISCAMRVSVRLMRSLSIRMGTRTSYSGLGARGSGYEPGFGIRDSGFVGIAVPLQRNMPGAGGSFTEPLFAVSRTAIKERSTVYQMIEGDAIRIPNPESRIPSPESRIPSPITRTSGCT